MSIKASVKKTNQTKPNKQKNPHIWVYHCCSKDCRNEKFNWSCAGTYSPCTPAVLLPWWVVTPVIPHLLQLLSTSGSNLANGPSGSRTPFWEGARSMHTACRTSVRLCTSVTQHQPFRPLVGTRSLNAFWSCHETCPWLCSMGEMCLLFLPQG